MGGGDLEPALWGLILGIGCQQEPRCREASARCARPPPHFRHRDEGGWAVAVGAASCPYLKPDGFLLVSASLHQSDVR